MKKHLILVLSLCSAVVFTGCKSKESAYRQAYELARAQEAQSGAAQVTPAPVVVTPQSNQGQAGVVNVNPASSNASSASNADVRTSPGGFTMVSGNPLKAYSVVVGSFVTQANAEGLMTTLKARGYDARVVKTNETINNQTGWFRVIASSYDEKELAVRSRDELKASYAGAWLLYNK